MKNIYEDDFIKRTKLLPMDIAMLFSNLRNPNNEMSEEEVKSWNQQASNIRNILDELIDEANLRMENK